MGATYTSFKGINNISEAGMDTHLAAGLKYFFDWSFLEIGAFFNVKIPTSGQYGGQQHQLRPVNDPNYQNGQVWEGFRKEWVWESGIDFATQPVSISGAYVDNAFYPLSTTGSYSHYIDYPLGRVVFNTPITPVSGVSLEYSFRWCPVFYDDPPWFQAPESFSFRNDGPNFMAGSGQWNQLAQDRLEMPCIVMQFGRRHASRGLMLGGGQIISQDIQFNILSENQNDARRIRDIILDQDEKSFYLFDLNQLANDDRFPLTAYGSLNPNRPPSYPELVQEVSDSGYRYKFCTFKRTVATPIQKLSANFHWTTATSTIEIQRPEIT